MSIVQKTLNVSSSGAYTIVIEQTAINAAGNSSTVNVRASLKNLSGSAVTINNVQVWIGGTQSLSAIEFSSGFAVGDAHEIISHNFTVPMDVAGNKSVSFSVTYGPTGQAKFGGNQNTTISATLVLDRIPKRPSQPGPIQISNHLTTSVTLSWDESTDDGGASISAYLLRRYNGATTTGSKVDDSQSSTSRNVTGLTAGATYTFQVFAYNGSADNGGYSTTGPGTTILMRAGPFIRVGGHWKLTAPYIRDNGTWKPVVSYVRKNGVWKTMG